MLRVTLHRVETGEPSVTVGAYLNAMSALGLDFGILMPPIAVADNTQQSHQGWIPARIRLADSHSSDNWLGRYTARMS